MATQFKTPDSFESINEIDSEEKFNRLLMLPKAIVYFQVNWSGPERASRSVVVKALSQIGSLSVPVFKIDDSESQMTFLHNWLMTQQKEVHHFSCGGSGAL